MPESLDLRNAPAGSPEWWLARLLARLEARRTDLETFKAFYDGHQPLAFASQKFRDAFGSRFRLDVLGFRELVAHPTAHAVARGLVAAMPHRMDITVC